MKTALIGVVIITGLFGGRSVISDRGASAGSAGEQYERTAEVFGINSIGDMTRMGIPNQCWSNDPASEPPVGRIFLQHEDGTWEWNGTGSVVGSNRVVVTNAHVVAYDFDPFEDTEVRFASARQVRFRLYEGTPADCREVDYQVQEAMYGELHTGVFNPEDDFAVLTLEEPVTAYAPHSLGTEHDLNMAVIKKKEVLVVGFPQHPDANYGLNYAASTCVLQFGLYSGFDIVHDCDTFPGSSGSPVTLVLPSRNKASPSRYERLFIALNTAHFRHPDAQAGAIYSARSINFNIAVHLVPHLRSAIQQAVLKVEADASGISQ